MLAMRVVVMMAVTSVHRMAALTVDRLAEGMVVTRVDSRVGYMAERKAEENTGLMTVN